MKLERLGRALEVANEFGLDSIDLSILADIQKMRAKAGAATIMQFSAGRPYASFGTIHARVKRMVKNGVLNKRVKDGNERTKIIEDGEKVVEFVESLYKVI